MTQAVLVTGAGGVGKTTIAAALGVAAARSGRSCLVLTVDPARRLADALGVERLGNEPRVTPGADGLSAAMLDAAESWENLIRRHADPDSVERILTSRFFRAISERFPAGQSYAAAEEMARHLESGAFDVVVVDTPPSAGGLDFFAAPRRMRTLVGGRVLRALTGPRIPGRRRLFSLTARPVLRIADSVLGGPLLQDVAEFLFDLRTAYDGIARSARRVERLLGAATTIVVTTADPSPVRETMRFFTELSEIAGSPAAVVLNRSLPEEWATAEAPSHGVAVAANLARWGAEAQRHRDVRADLTARHGMEPAVVPLLADAPTSLAGLDDLLAAAPALDLAELLP